MPKYHKVANINMIAIKEKHPPQQVPYFGLPLKYKSPGVENMSKNVRKELNFCLADFLNELHLSDFLILNLVGRSKFYYDRI